MSLTLKNEATEISSTNDSLKKRPEHALLIFSKKNLFHLSFKLQQSRIKGTGCKFLIQRATQARPLFRITPGIRDITTLSLDVT